MAQVVGTCNDGGPAGTERLYAAELDAINPEPCHRFSLVELKDLLQTKNVVQEVQSIPIVKGEVPARAGEQIVLDVGWPDQTVLRGEELLLTTVLCVIIIALLLPPIRDRRQ